MGQEEFRTVAKECMMELLLLLFLKHEPRRKMDKTAVKSNKIMTKDTLSKLEPCSTLTK